MMKPLLTLVMITFSCIALGSDYVFFLRGNLFDRHSPIHKEVEVELENFVKNNYPNVVFGNFHNSKWEQVCKLLDKKVIGKLIFVGHSWGVQAALQNARCIFKKTRKITNLLISFDPIQKPWHKSVTLIPHYVEEAYNWYQTQDFWLKGRSGFHRKDGSIHNIYEEHIVVSKKKWAHDRVMYDIYQTGLVHQLIDRVLSDE